MFRHVDWRALGPVYFHEGGERELRGRRGAMLDLGEEWARAANRLLPEGGRSLWAGAGIGDLPAMLAEALLKGREVIGANLRRKECRILSDALGMAGLSDALRIEEMDARKVAGRIGRFDHLAAVGLFTDPETYPALSGVAYGRIPPPALDLEAFERERREARELASGLFDPLTCPGLITTTAEEAAWFLERASDARVEPVGPSIPTAILGDPVGFLRVTAA